jgi:hypothetical protein
MFSMPWRPVADASGGIVPGAKAYFTNAGGDVKAPVYTDASLETQRANPVLADAAGKFPLTMLDGAVIYRLRIYARDATPLIDDPIEEYDPYVPGVFADASALEPVAAAAAASASSAAASAAAAAGVGPITSNPAIDPTAFGFVEGDAGGAHCAANNAAWAALKAALITMAVNSTGGATRGVPRAEFGMGTFEMSVPMDLNFGAMVISGQGSGFAGVGAQTRLKFYNSTGVRIQHSNTSGDTTKDGAVHYGGTGAFVHDIAIEGNYPGTGAEAEYHGIYARSKFSTMNVDISQFHGDGYKIDADAAGAYGGNANGWRIVGGRSWLNRNGIAVGMDANADTNNGTAVNVDCDLNRQAGWYDASLLGCTFVGCGTSSNGILGVSDGVTVPATCVSHGGKLYQVIVGQDAGASTNAPSGTTADNTWWWYRQAGAPGPGGPAWFNGINVRAGGAFISETDGAYSHAVGCYAEFDQPRGQGRRGSMVVGGSLTDWIRHGASGTDGCGIISGTGDGGSIKAAPCLQVQTGNVKVQWGAAGNAAIPGSEYIAHAEEPTLRQYGWDIRLVGSTAISFDMDGTSSFYQLGIGNASWTFGRSAAPQTGLRVPMLFLGGAVAGRGMTYDSAAPTTGPHALGEVVWNNGDVTAIGTVSYWQCTAAGTPGTWAPHA